MVEGEQQKFCLTWKDFNNVFNKEFNELRESRDFFDVTLACEDGQIPAHKLVLSAASDFFKDILRKANHEHPLIYLTGIQAKDVTSIMDFIYTGETEVEESHLELLLSTGGNLRIKGLTESSDKEMSVPETGIALPRTGGRQPGSGPPRSWDQTLIKAEGGEVVEEGFTLVNDDFEHQADFTPSIPQSSPINVSRFLSTTNSPRQKMWQPKPLGGFPRKLGHQRALVQSNNFNEAELNRQVSELMVSSYDPVLGKTIWQCAQCHYSSKLRYTVKEHVETHISGFCHQCPLCSKTCKTRNALRVHTIRKHGSTSKSSANVSLQQTSGTNNLRVGLDPPPGQMMEIGYEDHKKNQKEKKPLQPLNQEKLQVSKENPRQDDQGHMGPVNQGMVNHTMMGYPIMGGGFMGHPMMGHPSANHQPSHPST